VTEHLDQVRRKDTGEPGNGGQFAALSKGASGLSLHGEGARAGTAVFPPSFGGWTAGEYIDWWENVPLDDDGILKNVQQAYLEKWEERRYHYAEHHHNEWRRQNPDPGPKATFAAAEAWGEADKAAWEEINNRFRAMYPPRLPDTRVRGVYRAFKMWEYSAQLDADEQAKVLAHVVRLGDEDLTIQEAADKYRIDLIKAETRRSINETLMERLVTVLGRQQA